MFSAFATLWPFASKFPVYARFREQLHHQTPVVDKPVVDNPVVDKPFVDKPVVDKPLVDKLVLDKNVVNKSVVDKPVVDKPVWVTRNPIFEYSKFQEPFFENIRTNFQNPRSQLPTFLL